MKTAIRLMRRWPKKPHLGGVRLVSTKRLANPRKTIVVDRIGENRFLGTAEIEKDSQLELSRQQLYGKSS